MADFDSFDALTSHDPRDSALEVTLRVGGEALTLPWRIDGEANARLQEHHGREVGEVIEAVQQVAGGALDEETLREHGVESAKAFAELSQEKQERIAAEVMDHTDVGDKLEGIAVLLHAGFVRFKPQLPLEKVRAAIDMSSVARLPLGEMARRVMPSEDETAPERAGDGAEGKSQGEPQG